MPAPAQSPFGIHACILQEHLRANTPYHFTLYLMQLANVLEELKPAQQGFSFYYGWPGAVDDGVPIPSKEEFMKKCIDNRLNEHREEAVSGSSPMR